MKRTILKCLGISLLDFRRRRRTNACYSFMEGRYYSSLVAFVGLQSVCHMLDRVKSEVQVCTPVSSSWNSHLSIDSSSACTIRISVYLGRERSKISSEKVRSEKLHSM